MRVLLVARSLPFHQIGGMEIMTWDMARSLAKRGLEVRLLTTRADRLDPVSVIDGVEVVCVDAPPGRYSRDWWVHSRNRYEREFRRHTDIVLSVSAGAMSLARGRRVGQTPPFVAQLHGTTLGQMRSKFREGGFTAIAKGIAFTGALVFDRGYRNFDMYTTVGPRITSDLRLLQEAHLLSRRPSLEILNGVDAAAFAFSSSDRAKVRSHWGLTEDNRVVVTVSRVHRQKGIREGLAAFARAARENEALRYAIIGSGPYMEEAASAAAELEIASKVTFCGAVGREDLGRYLSAGDIFLFPTLHTEGLPLNLLEALANGLPAIVSKHISLLGQTQLIKVDPLNVEQMAAAILVEADRPAGERQSNLDDRYLLSTMAARYDALFHSLCGAAA